MDDKNALFPHKASINAECISLPNLEPLKVLAYLSVAYP